jgi:hypothetical protein
MMLAFIECKNGLHEPTADTAEETEADLPATETGSGRIRVYLALPNDDDWRFGLTPSHSA